MSSSHLIKLIIFLSAFLLFQLELIIGKIFLPNFGGSYLVWGGCVVFFQAALLFGYMYAYQVVKRVGIQRYRTLHTFLMFLPLFFFPSRSLPMKYPVHDIPMVFDIFWHLFVTIGPVFIVLSTMSIIWQLWLSASTLEDSKNPYTLFAVSNLGSFAALITYPFYFEMYYDVEIQQNLWRGGYFLLLLLQGWGWVVIKVREQKKQEDDPLPVLPSGQIVRWLLYSAAGVIMFLAVTNIVTAEITPMPLFWVIPLSLYLLSFTLNFKKRPYCPSWIYKKFHLITCYAILLYFIMKMLVFPVLLELILLFGVNFLLCMHAQYKLYTEKPPDHRQLGFYYTMVSLGGFLGGVAVTWVIPLISSNFVEYFCGFLLIVFCQPGVKRLQGKWISLIWILVLIGLLLVCPFIFPKYHILGFLFIVLIFTVVFSQWRGNHWALCASLVVIICLVDVIEPVWARLNFIYKRRNYYGISKVYEEEGVRYFLHGTTIHGAQHKEPSKRPLPLTYYGLQSPVAQVLMDEQFDFEQIGIVGLGIGTLSAYLDGSQKADYFELDPDILKMAQEYFDFLDHSRGRIRYVLGDARLMLKEEERHKYDLIIMDAFSGDSIPVQLVTREAIALYQDHLREDGIVLFNVSNRYVDIGRVLFNIAFSLGARSCYAIAESTYAHTHPATWIALTWDEKHFSRLVNELHWKPFVPSASTFARRRVWTDRYSNILPYIKYEELISSFINFKYLKMD